MHVRRQLPADLAVVLDRVHRLEGLAEGQAQTYAAVRASGRLLLACLEAGWRTCELVDAAGLGYSAARIRIRQARMRGEGGTVGLTIPPPPRSPTRLTRMPLAPVEDREWLTLTEAVEFTGARPSTIQAWQRRGLLPNTLRTRDRRTWLLRADLRRVMAAPRHIRGGVDRLALAAQLAA